MLAGAKGASIFGGGGFLFDTSTDGADSISLASDLSASSMIQANGGNALDITSGIVDSTVYGGQGKTTSLVLMVLPLFLAR